MTLAVLRGYFDMLLTDCQAGSTDGVNRSVCLVLASLAYHLTSDQSTQGLLQ